MASNVERTFRVSVEVEYDGQKFVQAIDSNGLHVENLPGLADMLGRKVRESIRNHNKQQKRRK